jgi:1-acyl-sn-glycerol-3-phosphate acyltransferase
METTPPKPVAEIIRHEITRLPELTPGRKRFRRLFRSLVRLLVRLLASVRMEGFENVVRQGPVLIVSNHLGDADWLVGLAFAPYDVDTFVKSELYDFPVLGKLLEAYGVIWIHRGQADRRAIRAALEGLQSGRILAIAPEGRESLTGALEEGTGGAAYLGLKSGAPVQPVTYTGTENARIFTNLKRLRRSRVTLTVGPAFSLECQGSLRNCIGPGTERIMHTLARQLPPEYQGVYRERLPGA